MTNSLPTIDRTFGKIEAHIENIWPAVKTIQKQTAKIEDRLGKIESFQEKLRGAFTVFLVLGSALSAILSVGMHLIVRSGL